MIQKKLLPLYVLLLFQYPLFAQTSDHVEVMTLGTFHFAFPNLDVVKVDQDDQIDVLETTYQSEINTIVNRIAAFKPTIIAIERTHREQPKINSLYQQYRKGNYKLGRAEDEQIGFRLAKKQNLDKIYAVDAHGKQYSNVKEAFADPAKASEFEHFYFNNPDTSKRYSNGAPVYVTEGILAELIRINQPDHIKKSLGNYLIGHFKYESMPYDYFGADFETGRWFNRNLRIFRNIQRINASEEDRILVIFGAGHLNLLNFIFSASPEYKLTSPLLYLEK